MEMNFFFTVYELLEILQRKYTEAKSSRTIRGKQIVQKAQANKETGRNKRRKVEVGQKSQWEMGSI